MSDKTMNVKKGLEGVVVDTTSISKVMPEINSLVYRGHPVQELAEKCSFEEVAYLLWNGDLPGPKQLEDFRKREREEREISPPLKKVIEHFPAKGHPMDSLRTAVSFLGLEDPRTFDNSLVVNREKAMKLLASIPSMIAWDYRKRKGLEGISPSRDLGMAANFFQMCFGEIPKEEILKAFEVSLILYAEHGFNASTFAARVVSSTTSDMHSAVTAAIGALKGPLHGGANEQVMHLLKEIETPEKAHEWMKNALAEKRKVMGFGHRVYRKGDSRVPTMKKYSEGLGKFLGEEKWQKISDILEEVMVSEKGIYPNLDFPAGPAYYLMGFDIDMFTPLFVMSRVTGWTAHIMEQTAANRIIRPLCQYTGPTERKVVPLEERG
ncbi:MAG: bifunctional 2-methylcitrate synthase/citrate synthase [Bacteriovoracales bacterium]|nr:bifunctional 2-methylcitrate synthase/citrate synthase [Bacteriovoracales bacterium]